MGMLLLKVSHKEQRYSFSVG